MRMQSPNWLGMIIQTAWEQGPALEALRGQCVASTVFACETRLLGHLQSMSTPGLLQGDQTLDITPCLVFDEVSEAGQQEH